jgi:mono/diheme cytochrome c family protein
MTTKSRLMIGDELRTMGVAIQANHTDEDRILLGGVQYSVADINAKIQTFLAAQARTVSALNAFHEAVAAERASNAEAKAFRSQVQGYAIACHGKDSPVVAQYGFPAAGPRKTTAATKAVAALKVKATRAARGTLGKKQRAKIKGVVDPAIAAALAAEPTDDKPEK